MAELKITTANFETEVLRADMPVLVDLYADWCGPCKMLAPLMAELAEEYDGVVRVGKLNVDEEPEIAIRYHVASIPTLLLFKDGAVVAKSVGYRPKEELREFFNQAK